MPQSMVEIAKELTLALIETGNMPPEDTQETLQKTYATLTALKAQEESGVSTPAPASKIVPVDWRKSMTKHAVTCLECGHYWTGSDVDFEWTDDPELNVGDLCPHCGGDNVVREERG